MIIDKERFSSQNTTQAYKITLKSKAKQTQFKQTSLWHIHEKLIIYRYLKKIKKFFKLGNLKQKTKIKIFS